MIGLLANFLGTEPRDTDAEPGAEPPRTPPDHETAAAVVTDDELLARLVEQLREGEVTDEQRRTLRQFLGPDRTKPIEVKLGHLQARVADIEAYSEALEAFIDGEGAGREILDELRTDIAALDEALEGVASRIGVLEDDHSALQDRVTRLDDTVASLGSHVREVEGRHSRELAGIDAKVDHVERAVEQSLDGVHRDIDRLHERLGGVRSEIESVAADVPDLGRLERAVSELESDLEAERRGLDELQDRLTTLEPLPAEMATVKHEVAELESFRSQFVDAVTVEAPSAGRG